MRLAGFLKNNKENTFQTPIYSNSDGDFFFHVLDAHYTISDFTKAAFKSTAFKKEYLSKKFEIGSKAALIFVGKEGYIHYNTAPSAIEEVIQYLNDTALNNESNAILDEAMQIKSRVFSDHFVVDNFSVKMHPEEDQIILSFDFPSPKSHLIKERGSLQIDQSEKETPSLRPSKRIQNTDPVFATALNYFNAVDMNFELTLKLRAEERRTKLKTFNYQFKLNQNSARRWSSSE